MLRNYFKILLRNFSRNSLFSFLNISGLAIGMACVISILAYVRYESNYDAFIPGSEKIYRINLEWKDDGQHVYSAAVHPPLAEVISKDLPAVQNWTRIYPYPSYLKSEESDKYKESGFCFADSAFFKVFDLEGIEGTLIKSLEKPFSLVLTKSIALKYFGRTDVVGEELIYQDERNSFSFNVTGVIADLPDQSHFKFGILASFSSLDQIMPWYNNWHHPQVYTYFKTIDNANISDLESLVQKTAYNYLPEYIRPGERTYSLQNLGDIHSGISLENEWKPTISSEYIKIITGVALFILIIASINFINLSTAQSLKRAKEIGVRKVVGAFRGNLIYQFLLESVFYTTVSFIIALLLSKYVLINLITDLTGSIINGKFVFEGYNILMAILFVIGLGVISGIYPALYLSGFKPVKVLKGKLTYDLRFLNVRKGLVGFQFLVSGVLIATTLIVNYQIDYLRTKNLGFEKDLILGIKLVDRQSKSSYEILKEELLKDSNIKNVAISSSLPGRNSFEDFYTVPEGAPDDSDYTIKTLSVGTDFLKTYNINLVEGRDFSEDVLTDQTEAYIINEAAAERFGWDEALGKELMVQYYTDERVRKKGTAIGVTENFHFESLHNPVEPLIIMINVHPHYADYLSIRTSGNNLSTTLKTIEEKWSSFNQDKPVEYVFLDEEIEKAYSSELRVSKIFDALTVLSIFVSCLGLFGLSAFSAHLKTKEIGIRKVLGASTLNILNLLSKEYVLLIIVGNAIGIPFVIVYAQGWLKGFAYRVDINPLIFLVSTALAVGIAWFTMSIQTFKAALANPVNSLKTE
ncbi:MAG: ABC transporter permease [Bacteroidota bacterium]